MANTTLAANCQLLPAISLLGLPGNFQGADHLVYVCQPLLAEISLQSADDLQGSRWVDEICSSYLDGLGANDLEFESVFG